MIVRRDVLKGAALGSTLLLAEGAGAQTNAPPPEQPAPFNAAAIPELARVLAKTPYRAPSIELPEFFSGLTYEQYVSLRYNPKEMIWANDNVGFVIEPLHRGFIFSAPMQINVVENGLSRRIAYRATDFSLSSPPALATPDIGFSGFRILMARDGKLAELAIFQGASFFKAVAPGQWPGVQSRGLSLKTGDSRGEEFPIFKAVWIEKPSLAGNALIIHALLDSESTTGAYRFTIRPGEAAIIDTELTLMPRATVDHVGIAAMSATSISTPLDRRRPDDIRPIIAEVNGLQMETGKGEWIWRPVTNRTMLQLSAFVDNNPRGFGFLVRNRDFDAYQDDEMKWNIRPSLWIEPLGEFGPGSVSLVEIPAESENNSNCIAYWRPAGGIVAGKESSWAYRQFWCWDPPTRPPLLLAVSARSGRGAAPKKRRFLVVFMGDMLGPSYPAMNIKPALSTSPGTVSALKTYISREANTYRVVFDIDPGNENYCEIRLVLESDSKPISETWLYRWTP